MTAAHKDAKLSGPIFTIKSENNADDALPEKGLVSSKGIISDGIPRAESGSFKTDEINSMAPDALSIDMAARSATNVGRSPTAVANPSFAPFIKLSK